MGLLDGLLGGGSGGGLLDFLRNNAMNQQFGSGLQSDQAQYGQPAMAQMPPQMFAPSQASPAGMPSQAAPQAPVPQQPPPIISAPPMQAPDQGPGFGDRLGAGLQSFANSGGPLSAVANGITSLITGQRSDPTGIALQQQNLTVKALIQKGVDPGVAQAAASNPDLLKTLITQAYGPDNVQALGNGYIYHGKTGKVERAYEPESKAQFVKVKDANGNEVPAIFDPDTKKVTPATGLPNVAPPPTGPVSMEDLQKSDPAMASQVQAVLDGRAPYPTGSRLNPKQQQLKELVTQIDPQFDSTVSRQRSKFNMEFGSTSPSSVGGQKILMGTALGHLGEVAQSAADLHNSDGGGMAFVGHWANAAKNMTTENAAKANALEDKVAKFSGEVGKLYSGSQGGGVHEREDTRHRMGSTLTSAELASGLEASRDLIISKQKALEDQAVNIFGPEKAAKYDFIGEDGRKALEKINTAIERLRGAQGAAPAAPASAPAALPKSGDIQGGYRFKGGNPSDKANWEPVA